MLQSGKKYPSDLTEQQWETIKEMIPPARVGGRPRTVDVRRIIDAIFYLNRTGCAWRYLPSEFPPWQTVYDYFSKWSKNGIWRSISHALSCTVREKENRSPYPHLGIIDAQSVRSHFGESRGWDGFKKVRGRKRSIIVDSLGLIWSCEVHAAVDQDRHGGVAALRKLPSECLQSLETILGDGAYNRAPFDVVVKFNYGLNLEAKTPKEMGGSNLKPKRWVVERTFAWFNHFRRLSRDYERISTRSESMIYLSMTQILLRRLVPP